MSIPSEKKTKHRELLELLKARIGSGEFHPGDQIPTLDQLCQTYGVSQITARNAISALVSERVLYSVRGKGTFVAEPPTSRTIALVFPHFIGSHSTEEVLYEYLYDMPLVGAIEQSARENGLNLLLYISDDDFAVERKNIRTVMQQQADAALVFYIGDEENRDILDELCQRIPTVLIDHAPLDWPGNFVGTDNFVGAHQATEALLSRGYSRVYFLTHPEMNTSNQDRTDGVVSALRGHGVYTENSVIRLSDYWHRQFIHDADAITEQLLRDETEPFAIFACNSQAFLGVWQAMQRLHAPLDRIGFACFDTPPVVIPPEVCFVQVIQQLEQIGRQSVQALCNIFAGEPQPQRVVLSPTVRVAGPAGFTPVIGQPLPVAGHR